MKQKRQRHCGVLTSVARGHGNTGRHNDRDGNYDDDYHGVEDEDVDGDVDMSIMRMTMSFKGTYQLWQVDEVR